MKRIAVIGGTGALAVAPADRGGAPLETPYGETSSPLLQWRSDHTEFVFIARHGLDSSVPPHRVNYRANVYALRARSPDFIVGLNAVGGITRDAQPARLVFPTQLIDYTWGRQHTYSDGDGVPLRHVEFTDPVTPAVHASLVDVAGRLDLDYVAGGIYGVTQGPRLETAAEIDRLERDGCDIVGMTAMPEAALARELEVPYAICAVVVNWAAGRAPSGAGIHAEIEQFIASGMDQAQQLLNGLS